MIKAPRAINFYRNLYVTRPRVLLVSNRSLVVITTYELSRRSCQRLGCLRVVLSSLASLGGFSRPVALRPDLFCHLVPSFGAIDLERPQLKQGRQLNLVAPPLPDPVGPSKLHVRPHQDKTHVSHVAVLRRAIRGVDANHDPLEIAYWATRALKRPTNHNSTPY